MKYNLKKKLFALVLSITLILTALPIITSSATYIEDYGLGCDPAVVYSENGCNHPELNINHNNLNSLSAGITAVDACNHVWALHFSFSYPIFAGGCWDREYYCTNGCGELRRETQYHNMGMEFDSSSQGCTKSRDICLNSCGYAGTWTIYHRVGCTGCY